jgi:hypothetical protein
LFVCFVLLLLLLFVLFCFFNLGFSFPVDMVNTIIVTETKFGIVCTCNMLMFAGKL